MQLLNEPTATLDLLHSPHKLIELHKRVYINVSEQLNTDSIQYIGHQIK